MMEKINLYVIYKNIRYKIKEESSFIGKKG